MFVKLDSFYSMDLLIRAKDHMLDEFPDQIQEKTVNPAAETIQLKDASLEIRLEKNRIAIELDQIPAFLQEDYHFSNVIEYNKLAETLSFLDLNKPPKSFAAKDEISKCELFLIAKIIEKTILLTFNLEKLSDFQFYTLSGNFLGILSRIRLNRDAFSGTYSTYDCLIFAERFKVEKRHIAILKDFLEIINEEDYCLANLPDVLDELEGLTTHPFIEAEKIRSLEQQYKNRVKIPKRPIFYRVPFLAWDQRQTQFYVPAENISEVIY